ncbi:hypothetical protein EDD36DRAFT_285421 [Exophiala viscosa]|uniref:Zn(2)-C6 fungal-type domain-containing protein n=1 Tax=Exophiala viscosa TaxID=2486360 RepID=A0AAN6ID85_9EURO|nr:hypothetical protein EDD36DRAFT_285421 [Exophiala viscosa]
MSTEDGGRATSTSPGRGQVPARKRRRPALSCEQCRNRKVKCDRNFPSCDRCIRMDQAHACAYSNDVFSRMGRKRASPQNAESDHASAPNNRSRLLPQQAGASPLYRPRQGTTNPATAESLARPIPAATDNLLEGLPDTDAAVAGETSTQVTRRSIRSVRSISSCIGGSMYFEGRDSQTRFFGQTNPMNMYSQFGELRAYIKEIKSENPTLINLRTEFEAFQRDRKKGVSDGRSLDGLVPPRQTADELVALYLDYFEPTHRVLHKPSFRREYARYWGSPESASPGFVAQLLAMMAAVLVMHNSSAVGSSGIGPAVRETAREWVNAAESFLQRHTKRPDLRIFQICCLSIVSRRLNGLSENQAWIATGSLVKMAMSAGYHREPRDLAKVSPFYLEMRRRIWATIVELDLQASIDRGMLPSVREGDFNTTPPMNLSDDSIDETVSDLPTSEPLEVVTDSAFQAALTTSLSLRLRICAWANSANIELDYEDALNMDEELSRHLNSMPVWSCPTADDASNQQSPHARVLLQLVLRQYVILLHTPFASLGQHISKYAHSRRVRLETATTILCQCQDILQPSTSNMIRCIVPSGTIQAALAVCHELYMSDAGYASPHILRTVPAFAESLIGLAETALTAIETQLYMIGKKASEFYLLTMVLSLLKARLWPTTEEASRSKAVEQILRIGQRLYAWQMQAEAEKTLRRKVGGWLAHSRHGYP